MPLDPSTYPSRAFIRFTAQNQLLADITGSPVDTFVNRGNGETSTQQVMPSEGSNTPLETTLDEELFEEVAQIVFNSNRYPELYESCGSKRAAAAVEARVANEFVETYKQIKQRQNCAFVQRLNSLL
jgi:hypothetical protein